MNDFSQDVVLISLQVDLDTIGLKSLHATLLHKGFSSSILYLPGLQPGHRYLIETVGRWLHQNRPLLIGISLMSHEYAAAVALTEFLRSAAPDVPILWGGIHPTIAPEMCLRHADYVCVGEGELALVEFLRALKQGRRTESVCGIRSAKGKTVATHPPAPQVADLDGLPFTGHLPRHGFIAHRNRILPLTGDLFKHYARWKGTVYSFMGSRGCIFSCAYCCNETLTRIYGKKRVRRRSVESIMAELETIVSRHPDIEYVNFQDDCFLACTDEYLAAFSVAYRARIHKPFVVRCIPSFITAARLEQLKQAGLAWISMGLQSGSDRVLRDIYTRRSLSRDFLEAAAIIRESDVAAYYDVILDNPFETDAERLETIGVLSDVPRPYFLQLFSLVLYPGTGLYFRMGNTCGRYPTDYLVKNYHDYRKTDLNRLLRASAYLPVFIIRHLTTVYKKEGATAGFRFRLRLAELVSAFWLEPVTALRVLHKSRQGNIVHTLKILPAFFRVGVSRYIKQFGGKTGKRIEHMIRDHSSGDW